MELLPVRFGNLIPWTKILTPNGSQGGFAGLAVDPHNPNTLMVGTICRWWPSGTSSANAKNSLRVYPNPFDASTTIDLNNGELIDQVQVFNSTGTLVVHKSNINHTHVELDDALLPGIYTVHIKTRSGNYIAKLVKN